MLKNNEAVRTEFIEGRTLLLEIIDILNTDGWSCKDLVQIIKNWLLALCKYHNIPCKAGAMLPGVSWDMLPHNSMSMKDGSIRFFDMEWEIKNEIAIEHVLFRGILIALMRIKNVAKQRDGESINIFEIIESIMDDLGLEFDKEAAQEYLKKDNNIQFYICGNKLDIKNYHQAELTRRCDKFYGFEEAVRARDSISIEREIAIDNMVCAFKEREIAIDNMVCAFKERDHAFISRDKSIDDLQKMITATPDITIFYAIKKRFFDLCRSRKIHEDFFYDGRSEASQADLPKIDISVVTHNSQQYIDKFMERLMKMDYPHELLSVCFVDNGSSDDTVSYLEKWCGRGIDISITKSTNRGFGAGHNIAISKGAADFVLISNVDLEFRRDTLQELVHEAVRDPEKIAAWEARQEDVTQEKFYDLKTWVTRWNAHTCVLMRRSAFEGINGYDENIFMYGEDVELSFRLRCNGFLLRYIPSATVLHDNARNRPIMYPCRIFANLYLRVKYGAVRDMVAIPLLMIISLIRSPECGSSRTQVLNALWRFIKRISSIKRQGHTKEFSFNIFNYD